TWKRLCTLTFTRVLSSTSTSWPSTSSGDTLSGAKASAVTTNGRPRSGDCGEKLKSVGSGYLLSRCETHTGLVPFTPSMKGQIMTMTEPELIDVTDGEEAILTVAEFLAQWGCDPCYDRHPRRPG